MNNNNYSDVRLTGIMRPAIGVTNPRQPLLETLRFVTTFKNPADLEKGKQFLKTISNIFHDKCYDNDGYGDSWNLLPMDERIDIIETNITTFKNQILESIAMNICPNETTDVSQFNAMDTSPDETNDKQIENNDVSESNAMDTSPDETNDKQFENFEPLFAAVRFAFIGDEQNIRIDDHYLIDYNNNITKSFPYIVFVKRINQKEKNWIQYERSDFSFDTKSAAQDASLLLSTFYKSDGYNFTPEDIDRIKRCMDEFSYKYAKPPKEIQKLENFLRFVQKQQEGPNYSAFKNLNIFKNIKNAINEISEADIQKIQDYLDNPNVIDSHSDKMTFHNILDFIQFDSLPTFDVTTIGSDFGFFYFKY